MRSKSTRSDNEVIMTSKEVIVYLGINRIKLWRLTTSGELPAFRTARTPKGRLRFRLSDVKAWRDSKKI